ncbi:MAG: hypothetical protein KDA22_05930 [Phycisphaerales bacterium]|nr:hypothetical protein [Phycisphaerales bacterium]
MTRTTTIVGIGEALLVEAPEQEEIGGIAADVSIAAVMLGQHGVAITRLGQDEQAARVEQSLLAAGVDVAHVQSDPDLPTGRKVVRMLAGARSERLDARSAFDNLQWDFDLEDIAARADGIVYGLLARRDGQARSTMDRFLLAASSAVRLLDLCNRDANLMPERLIAVRAIESAQGIATDAAALRLLLPGDPAAPLDLARRAIREWRLRFALLLDGGTLQGLTPDGIAATIAQVPAEREVVARIACLYGLLLGRSMDASIAMAERVASSVSRLDGAKVSSELLRG